MSVTPIHIAYADDHLVVRKGIISLLNNLGGIEVDIEASNGKELIEQLVAAPCLPSICILDINMPVMDGFDTIIEIKKRWPKMKALVLTIFEAEHYIIRMIRYGANGYLLKTCDPAEIKCALIAIHQKGIYHSTLVPAHLTNLVKNNLIKQVNLTEKEMAVMKYCCSDLTYSDIGQKLGTTTRSVEGIRDSLFRKLQVASRVSLALYAVQFGLVPLEIGVADH